MITVKYKGEVVDLKDIEITWVDSYGDEKTSDIEDYGNSQFLDGFDEGCEVD